MSDWPVSEKPRGAAPPGAEVADFPRSRFVSVVLPVHNQADHIGGIVDEYEAALAALPSQHEIILVINACRDDSAEICRGLSSQYPAVRMVETQPGGWGFAVKLGLAQARGDVLCYTNCARTSAEELRLLILHAFANPGDVVKAHRISRESPGRKIGSLLYNTECRLLFNLPAWDINATPKVFSRDIYEAIRPQSDGDLIDLEVYVKCMRLGRVVLEVPVYSTGRHGGKSTTTLKSAWRMYRGAFRMWRDLRHGRGVFSSRHSA